VAYDLTLEEVIYLRDTGVPDSVIASMMRRGGELRAQAADSASLQTNLVAAVNQLKDAMAEGGDQRKRRDRRIHPVGSRRRGRRDRAVAARRNNPGTGRRPSPGTARGRALTRCSNSTAIFRRTALGIRCPPAGFGVPAWWSWIPIGCLTVMEAGGFGRTGDGIGVPITRGDGLRFIMVGGRPILVWDGAGFRTVFGGPSWVTWRHHGTYIGWAPLPPGCGWRSGFGLTWHGEGVSLSFGFGLASHCYTFVSGPNFCHRNLHHHVVRDHDANNVYNHSTVINNVINGNNNTIVNNGVGYNTVAEHVRGEIPKARVETLPDHSNKSLRADRMERSKDGFVVYRPTAVESVGGRPSAIRPEVRPANATASSAIVPSRAVRPAAGGRDANLAAGAGKGIESRGSASYSGVDRPRGSRRGAQCGPGSHFKVLGRFIPPNPWIPGDRKLELPPANPPTPRPSVAPGAKPCLFPWPIRRATCLHGLQMRRRPGRFRPPSLPTRVAETRG
jgi:hypothetical protein